MRHPRHACAPTSDGGVGAAEQGSGALGRHPSGGHGRLGSPSRRLRVGQPPGGQPGLGRSSPTRGRWVARTAAVEHLRRPTQISAVLDIVAAAPHPGIILHWLLGSAAEIDRAAALGCYFSVNAAMPDQTLLRIPAHRMLPETDFPSRRSTTRARLPGDTTALDQRLADLGIVPRRDIRGGWYRDLRTLASRVDVIPRLACRTPGHPRRRRGVTARAGNQVCHRRSVTGWRSHAAGNTMPFSDRLRDCDGRRGTSIWKAGTLARPVP